MFSVCNVLDNIGQSLISVGNTRTNKMRVPEHFAGKNIFITGGTGFIGKALIEKCLRSCSDIENIFVLIREKKGKSAQERLNAIADNALFDVLRESNPKALNKLVAIEGDVSKLKLGISEKDWKLLAEKVNFIYHLAASVRFDDHLRDSIFINVRSTREIVQLAYDAKELMAFVHMSTTYCNVDKSKVEERVYPSHGDWQEAIRTAEEVDPTILEILTQKYIAPLPNTYTYTKGLAESAVVDLCQGRIPAVIVRPAIVLCTHLDPIPGWNDNFNGPVGLLVAGGKGLVRITYGRPGSIQDYVPVDDLTKIVISSTVEKYNTNDINRISVYNCSTFKKFPMTLEQLINMGKDIMNDISFREILWYPRTSLTSCWYNYYIQVLLFHMIPAMFFDLLLILGGKKAMVCKLQRKIYVANFSLYPFMSQTWDFMNDNIHRLNDNLSPDDLGNFGWIEFKTLNDRFQFYQRAAIGGILYLLKETFDMEENRRVLKRRWILDIAVKTIFALVFCWCLFMKLT